MIQTFYQSAPHITGGNGGRAIGPGVMFVVALRYEAGWAPDAIAEAMRLPLAAVNDIIATFEYRAERYRLATRKKGRKT